MELTRNPRALSFGVLEWALREACAAGLPREVESLLALGADPKAKCPDSAGRAALAEAARGASPGHAECARLLLPLGDPSSRCDGMGRSALDWAAVAGNLQSVKALLPHSDPKAPDRHGWTALMHAAENESPECCALLLSSSNPDARSEEGFTALMAALMSGSPAVALLAPATNLRLADSHGDTPLSFEAGHGRVRWIPLLMAAGPPGRFATSSDAKRARSRAQASGHPEAAALIGRLIEARSERSALALATPGPRSSPRPRGL